MRMSIERGIDGMVGRMLSWLTHPPARRTTLDEIEDRVEDLSETVRETVAVGEEAEDAAEKAAKTAAALIEDDGEPDGADSGELEDKLVAALADLPEGASMKRLLAATDGTPYATRQRLNQLILAGRVERRGQGMRTRYHRVES